MSKVRVRKDIQVVATELAGDVNPNSRDGKGRLTAIGRDIRDHLAQCLQMVFDRGKAVARAEATRSLYQSTN